MECQNKDMSSNFSDLFSKSLAAHAGWLHFAAHSHHLWPDVTADAHMQCWQDGAALADRKWEKVFGEIMPETRRHIARILSLPDASSIAFAPNTHEFVLRLISCLPAKPKILTTDSEFHSSARQFKRLEEAGLAEITRIPTEPFTSFTDRFSAAAAGDFDMVFLSQVFFNSGFAVGGLEHIAAATNQKALLVIDGYHAFMAIPVNLSRLANRAFYIAGGYKYAMSGEGCCFMHVPPDLNLKPVNTGWYASFGALEEKQDGITAYAPGGGGFMGATFDPSGIYRFNAVNNMLLDEGLTVTAIDAHVKSLQEEFIAELDETALNGTMLAIPAERRGHFLTFVTPKANLWHRTMLENKIIADVRADRLRLGFGLYHGMNDVANLLEKLANIKTIMLSEHS